MIAEKIEFDKKLVHGNMLLFISSFDFSNVSMRYNDTVRSGTLSEKLLSNVQNENIDVLIEAIASKKFQDIRKFILENWHGSETRFVSELFMNQMLEKAAPSNLLRYYFDSFKI